MLHEEVIVNWDVLQEQLQDTKLLDEMQMDFIPGVNNFFSCNLAVVLKYFFLCVCI